MLQTKVVDKIKTHILCSIFFFFENRAVYEIMWKNTVQPERPQDDNMAHAHCMSDIQGYRHRLRIRNNYRFSTAIIVVITTVNCHSLLSVLYLLKVLATMHCDADTGGGGGGGGVGGALVLTL